LLLRIDPGRIKLLLATLATPTLSELSPPSLSKMFPWNTRLDSAIHPEYPGSAMQLQQKIQGYPAYLRCA